MRKLGRLAEAAELAVELPRQLLARRSERRAIERDVRLAGGGMQLAEHLDQRFALPLDRPHGGCGNTLRRGAAGR